MSRKQKECEDDLVKAEPALVAATAALNTLNKVGTQLLLVVYVCGWSGDNMLSCTVFSAGHLSFFFRFMVPVIICLFSTVRQMAIENDDNSD